MTDLAILIVYFAMTNVALYGLVEKLLIYSVNIAQF